jgi:pSer/pThr/pTyr-binding forkhead associated (FHA) protein
VFRDAEGRDLVLELRRQVVWVGRTVDCVIRTNNPFVARHHSTILFEDGRYVVEDTQTPNGTCVNGVRVQRQALKHNDVVRCGGFELRFIEDDAPAHDVAASMPGARDMRSLLARREVEPDHVTGPMVYRLAIRGGDRLFVDARIQAGGNTAQIGEHSRRLLERFAESVAPVVTCIGRGEGALRLQFHLTSGERDPSVDDLVFAFWLLTLSGLAPDRGAARRSPSALPNRLLAVQTSVGILIYLLPQYTTAIIFRSLPQMAAFSR